MRDRAAPGPTCPPQSPPGRGFLLGASLTAVGMPAAFPYLGAIDQILRAELGPAASGLALLFYNLVFLIPLGALLVVHLVLPASSGAIFRRVASFTDRWGRHLGVGVLVCVGAVLIADGIGWLLGYPLLPVA